jgi:hypothetical protein
LDSEPSIFQRSRDTFVKLQRIKLLVSEEDRKWEDFLCVKASRTIMNV